MAGIDRRTFVVGAAAASVTLSSCDPNKPDGGPTWVAIVAIAGVASIFATAGGFVGGVFGMARLVALANRVSSLTTLIERIETVRKIAVFLMPAAHAQTPDASSQPIDSAPAPRLQQPSDGDAEYCGLDRVAFVSGPVTINVEGKNNTSIDFLTHNVFTVVREASAARPTTVADMESSSQQTFGLSMPAGETMKNEVTVDSLAAGATYIVYTWCIPTTVERTDAIVESTVMIGPILHCCDPYDMELTQAVGEFGSNLTPTSSFEIRREWARG